MSREWGQVMKTQTRGEEAGAGWEVTARSLDLTSSFMLCLFPETRLLLFFALSFSPPLLIQENILFSFKSKHKTNVTASVKIS